MSARCRRSRPGTLGGPGRAGVRLDLDDLGSEQGEEQRGVGTGRRPREVDDAEPARGAPLASAGGPVARARRESAWRSRGAARVETTGVPENRYGHPGTVMAPTSGCSTGLEEAAVLELRPRRAASAAVANAPTAHPTPPGCARRRPSIVPRTTATQPARSAARSAARSCRGRERRLAEPGRRAWRPVASSARPGARRPARSRRRSAASPRRGTASACGAARRRRWRSG